MNPPLVSRLTSAIFRPHGRARATFLGALLMSLTVAATHAEKYTLNTACPQADGKVLAIAEQPDGSRIVGGSFGKVGTSARNNMGRITAGTTQTVNASFFPNPYGPVNAIALMPDGTILIGGQFETLHGGNATTTAIKLARLSADGYIDTTFVAGLVPEDDEEAVFAILPQPNGKVLVGGRFSNYQSQGGRGATRNNIFRLNEDGSLDTSFNPNANGPINSIARQADGKFIIAGEFTSLQPNGAATATVRNRIARLNLNGTLDTTFNPNANGPVRAVAVQWDGKIVLGGDFTALQPNGAPSATVRNRIARLNADGTIDTAFDPNCDGQVSSISLGAAGHILLSGSFSSLRPAGATTATARKGAARLLEDGTVDPLFSMNADGPIHGIQAILRNSAIVCGGAFANVTPNRYPDTPGAFAPLKIARANLAEMTMLDTVSENITAVGQGTLRFTRTGADLPDVSTVSFEISVSESAAFGPLATAVRITKDTWEATGLTLPAGKFYIKARSRTNGGCFNGSSGLLEKVQPVTIMRTDPPKVVGTPPNYSGVLGADGAAPPEQVLNLASYFTFTNAPLRNYTIPSSNTSISFRLEGSQFFFRPLKLSNDLNGSLVTVQAADTNGATSSISFYAALRDATPPVFGLLPAITATVPLGESSAVIPVVRPTVTDNSGTVSTLSLSKSWPADDKFPVGQTTFTWTAKDSSGNEASIVQTVSVLPSGNIVPSGVASLTGSPAPGTTDNYAKFVRVQLNSSGEIAFLAELSSATNKVALFTNGGLGKSATPVQIVRQGTVLPTNGAVKFFDQICLQNNGQIFFVTRGTPNKRVLWSRPVNGTPQMELNAAGGALPGLDSQHVLDSLEFDLSEGGGAAVFQMDPAKLPAAEKGKDTGVLVRNANGWTIAALSGANAVSTPQTGKYGRFFTNRIAAASGRNVGYAAEILYPQIFYASGIFSYLNGQPTLIASTVMSVPGDAPRPFDEFLDEAVAARASDNYLFKASWSDKAGNRYTGLFTNSNGSVARVAVAGKSAPFLDASQSPTYREFKSSFIDSAGGAIFSAEIDGYGDASRKKAIFHRAQGATARMLIAERAAAPGLPAGPRVASIDSFAVSENGWVVVSGQLETGVGGVTEADNSVLWTAPPGGKLTVRAREGWAIAEAPGVFSLIADLTLAGANNIINNTGQVAVIVTLRNDRQAAMVLNP